MPLWNPLKPFGSGRRNTVPESNKNSNASHHRGNTEPGGGWIPLALETPILLGFMILSLLLFATIETLAQRSQAQHGLALSPSYDDIPQYAMIIYLYGPNVVGVLYSLIWNWIDLDVKRMQPWFELSKPSGAAAKDSILLDYPSDFVAAAPIRAAKRKHWPVFLSGTTLILIFWVLTPLQTALLGVTVTKISQPVPIVSRSQFKPTSEQSLNMRKFNQAYGIDWLNESYPSFTTPNYALLPFYVNEDVVAHGTETNWTAETTKVWSEFSCTPIKHNITDSTWSDAGILTTKYTFYGKENCTTTHGYIGTSPKYTPLPGFPTGDDLFIDYFPCGDNTNESYSAIVIWAKQVKEIAKESDKDWEMNITAIDCELSYHKQRVIATVDSETQQPILSSVKPLEEPQNLTTAEFDFTKLTSIIPVGWQYNLGNPDKVWDWVDTFTLSLGFKFNDWNITTATADMIPYTLVLGDDNATRDTYHDPHQLGKVFERFHQQFFSLSISDLLMNETTSTNDTATIISHMTGIVVSRRLSAVSEALLLLVAIMVAIILYLVRSSPCDLLRNPSSVGRLLNIGHSSPDVVKLFRDMDTADESRLMHKFETTKFKLTIDRHSTENQLVVLQHGEVTDEPSQKTTPGFYVPLTPWVLKRRAGAGFVLVLISSLVILSIFKAREVELNGLIRPSESFEVLQILENYVPTIFATLIEPIWIYLTRTLCIFQPFQDLWIGRALAATSIEATYTSLPPQLVLFRSIKSRHTMLSLLCCISLLANLLAVGLGALFNERPVEAQYKQQFYPSTQEGLDFDAVFGYRDYWFKLVFNHAPKFHNYITLNNMSSGTPLPPWVSADWFFLPHSIAGDDDTPESEYSLQVRGYGAHANCTSTPTCLIYTKNNTMTGASPCLKANNTIGNIMDYWLELPLEEPAQMTYADFTNVDSNMAWLRRSPKPGRNNSVEASFLVCKPYFETAMFSLRVDRDGRVLNHTRISGIEHTVNNTAAEMKNITAPLFDHFGESIYTAWKNNANWWLVDWSSSNRTTDWMSEFIFLETKSREMTDPTLPPPDASKLIPVVEKIYRRLFSTFLSVNPQLFLMQNGTAPSVTGTRFINETRIFMDKPAFIISVSMLFINLGVIMAFYVRPVRYILPRMPTTIGSILAYLAPSRAVKDGTPSSGWGDQTFSFGRYIGYDGLSHIGIETDPHVLPKDLSLGLHKTLLGREKNAGENGL